MNTILAQVLRDQGAVYPEELILISPCVDITLTVGTREILYQNILLFTEKLEQAGVYCNLIIGELIIHCYPICPIPEAEPVRKEILAAIVRKENDK